MYEFLDKRYAQALYDVALTKGKTEEYIEQVQFVVDLIHNNKELASVLKNPEISIRDKKHLFIDAFKGKLDEDVITFLLILIEKDRILFLDEKLVELKKIDLNSKNMKIAHVQTAVSLTEEEKEKLKEKLGEKYNATMVIDEIIDPEIIGGLIIKVGDDLIDASVRNDMNSLKNNLLEKIE